MAMAAIDFQLLANAGFPPATFKLGEVIFTEGDKGDKMYVIRSGEVEIERDGKSWRSCRMEAFSGKWP